MEKIILACRLISKSFEEFANSVIPILRRVSRMLKVNFEDFVISECSNSRVRYLAKHSKKYRVRKKNYKRAYKEIFDGK